MVKIIKKRAWDHNLISATLTRPLAFKKRNQALGRNIHKNTAIVVAEHCIPVFKPAGEFNDELKAVVVSSIEIRPRVA